MPNGKIINILASRDYENFSNITRDDSIKISQENLPLFETVRIRIDPPRKRNFNQGRERFGRNHFRQNRASKFRGRNNRHRF